MIFRRLGTAAAGAAIAVAATASPAAAFWGPIVDHDEPQLVGDREVSLIRGSETWINLGWTSDQDITDFSMTVEASTSKVEIAYPDHDLDGTPDDAAGLFWDNDLVAGELDTAAFELTTTVRTPSYFWLKVYAHWTDAEGVQHSEKIDTISVRTSNYKGDDYELLTSQATVFSGGDGANNWVEFDFLGVSPMNNDFDITVRKGLDEVYYPQETYTSLHHDDKLDGSEEDVARVWIDPATVTPGTYEVEIEVDYIDNEGKKKSNRHDITLTVLAADFQG